MKVSTLVSIASTITLALAAPRPQKPYYTYKNSTGTTSPEPLRPGTPTPTVYAFSTKQYASVLTPSPSPTLSPSPDAASAFESLLSHFNASSAATAAPSSLPQADGQEYVVLFDPDHPTPPEVSEVLQRIGINGTQDINYVYDNSAFRGFAGVMGDDHVQALVDMQEVKFVEASVKISSFETLVRGNSPWGLQRISQQGKVSGDDTKMAFQYSYDSVGNLGQGVDIYIVDTGINIAHQAFGGRATMGFSKDGAQDLNAACDQDGHGTHVAGTAAANIFGVASGANLIGVKVLGADGSGYSSDTIKGLDYVVRTHDKKKTSPLFVGSIASMSWGLSARSDSVEQAINAAVDAGVHVSVAAGNQGTNACNGAPASTGGKGADGKGGKAVAVGSINNQDQISTFSNTGQCVDVYAPGEYILSTWIKGTNTVNALSGTSMACPHVTGLMAYLMARNATLAGCPAFLKEYLASTAFAHDLTAQKAVTGGDLGLLVNNGVKGVGKQDYFGNGTVAKRGWEMPKTTRVALRW